jgi:hypothetical protein
MGILAPTSVCVHATAPPPPRLGARGKRLAEQLRRRSVVKMNYPLPQHGQGRKFTETSHLAFA